MRYYEQTFSRRHIWSTRYLVLRKVIQKQENLVTQTGGLLFVFGHEILLNMFAIQNLLTQRVKLRN